MKALIEHSIVTNAYYVRVDDIPVEKFTRKILAERHAMSLGATEIRWKERRNEYCRLVRQLRRSERARRRAAR